MPALASRISQFFSRAAVAASLLWLGSLCVASATTFVVTTTSDTLHGSCGATCSLRDAIIAANANPGADVITLPSNASSYVLTIPGTGEENAATGDLDITGDLTINGGGAATTVIDGLLEDRVFDIKSGVAVVFNDITIQDGQPASADNGGGIQNAGTLTLNRCVVLGNHTNVGNGAGIYNTGTLNVNNSTISGNTAAGGGNGGGIDNESVLTVNSSRIINNVASNNGGGIYHNGNSMDLNDSTVDSNIAGSGLGGGIFFNGIDAFVTRSTISNNSAGNGNGGGIFNNGNGLTVTNSTISGNGAHTGAGFADNGLTVSFVSTTITNNTATTGGGGVVPGIDETFKNTIIAGNSAPTGVNCSSPITNSGTNLQFPGTSCGAGIPSADPLLNPLANNGGPTQTHALSAGSPAIDAGTTGCPPPATDQRGVARPQGVACDIGSFEFQGVSVPTSTPTVTPTQPAATATPTATSVPATATLTPTSVAGVVVPTLSPSMLGLLGLALAGIALLLVRRSA